MRLMRSLEGRGVGGAGAAVRVVGRSLLDWAGGGGVDFKIFHAISFFAAAIANSEGWIVLTFW